MLVLPSSSVIFVLNAVWRHWIVHSWRRPQVCRSITCSTPFGVIGLFTRLGLFGSQRQGGAQRRLASLDCSHSTMICGPNRNACAQRRLASLDCSHGLVFPPRHRRTGAQRRLASLDCSREVSVLRTSERECSTPFGVIGLFTPSRALPSRQWTKCSTPFGVIGLFTWLRVLFRAAPRPCSTPFGVIGLFTPRRQRGAARARKCAQRRLASLDCSLDDGSTSIGTGLCSTPFGVIGLFTSASNVAVMKSWCAQRRLASLDCSRRLDLHADQ